MVKKQALFVLSVLLQTGCLSNVVALKPEAKSVQMVHETDRPIRCKLLAKISGTSRDTDDKAAQTGAENDFRNHAAEEGGNFALVEAERHGPVGTSSQKDYFVGGRALLCETEEMEEAQAKADAEAKEQKEKAASEAAEKEAAEKKEQADAKKAKK